jgi:hypothetical protein
METQEFVSFCTAENGQSVKNEHFFRKDKVTYFGVTERMNKGNGNHYFDVRITYETSDTSSDTFQVSMPGTAEFEMFRDQMLDTQAASAEELDKIRNSLSHMDAPEEPRDIPENPWKPDILDTFVIPDNATGFYYTLLTKAHYSDNGGKWSVTRHGTRFDCRCKDPDTKENFTVTILFTSTLDSSYARVTDIQADGTLIRVDQYNHYLCRFVDEMVKPFAEIKHFRYEYSGDSGELITP